jgi:hypothetical protein
MAPTKAQKEATAKKRKETLMRNTAEKTSRVAKNGKKKAPPPLKNTRRRPLPPDNNGAADDDEDDDNEDDEEEQEQEEEEDEMAGLNPLQRQQLINMRNEEKRAAERHAREMSLLPAHQPAQGGAQIQDADDIGESSLTPFEKECVDAFMSVPKRFLVQIARNKFDPSFLPYLDKTYINDNAGAEKDYSFEGGRIRSVTTLGNLQKFGDNVKIWDENFATYTAIVVVFFGPKYPHLIIKLIKFRSLIVKQATLSHWKNAVLPLALQHHRNCLINGIGELEKWDLQPTMIHEYCSGHELGRGGGRNNGRGAQEGSGQGGNDGGDKIRGIGTNRAGIPCLAYQSAAGCQKPNCKRDHVKAPPK